MKQNMNIVDKVQKSLIDSTYKLSGFIANQRNCELDENGFVDIGCYSDLEPITKLEIQKLLKQYNIKKFYYGYFLWTSSDVKNYQLDTIKRPYFYVKTNKGIKLAVPVKVNNVWYLTFEQLYMDLDDNTLKILLNGKQIVRENGEILFGLILIKSDESNIENVKLLEKSYYRKLLSFMESLGSFIRRMNS